MALIKCPDCAAEVSDAAPACLKCGRPIALAPPYARPYVPARTPPAAIFGNVLWGLVAVALILIATAWLYNKATSGNDLSADSSSQVQGEPQAQAGNETRQIPSTRPKERNSEHAAANASSDGARLCSKTAASGYSGLSSPRHKLVSLSSHAYSSQAISSAACFNGKDIADWVAGSGMMVTSSMIEDPPEVAQSYGVFSTLEANLMPDADPAEARSAIVLVRVSKNTGSLERQVLLKAKDSAVPEKALYDFKIAGINSRTGIVYFEVPAWAVSDAVHALQLPLNASGNTQQWFVAAGNLDFVYDAENSFNPRHEYDGYPLIATSRVVPGQGRIAEVHLYTPSGKDVCALDTRETLNKPPHLATIRRPNA